MQHKAVVHSDGAREQGPIKWISSRFHEQLV